MPGISVFLLPIALGSFLALELEWGYIVLRTFSFTDLETETQTGEIIGLRPCNSWLGLLQMPLKMISYSTCEITVPQIKKGGFEKEPLTHHSFSWPQERLWWRAGQWARLNRQEDSWLCLWVSASPSCPLYTQTEVPELEEDMDTSCFLYEGWWCSHREQCCFIVMLVDAPGAIYSPKTDSSLSYIWNPLCLPNTFSSIILFEPQNIPNASKLSEFFREERWNVRREYTELAPETRAHLKTFTFNLGF